ncbi:immunoglobulin lambda-1 light chain-like [Heptranchias perlo]|uniref:immunoglobulin lambda-1 light chain-like n=1 Tax=Heptranchias perlo TaxID=212740 RepID=UPI00355A8FA3
MSYWIRIVSTLVFCVVYLNAQVTVNQPRSMSTSPGNNVQISCTMSGANLGSGAVSWYQQIPGNTPRLLVYYWSGSSIYRGPGISERFSGSVSGNTGIFTMSNAQSEDAADYYCAMWSNGIFFGKETRLCVGSPQEPSVSVLPPSSDEITTKNMATLVCLVNRFKPGAVEIEWTVDGSVRGNGVETSRIQQETDNTFSVSSYLTLSASEWNSHELYSCVVKHETQASPLQTSIARSSCI